MQIRNAMIEYMHYVTNSKAISTKQLIRVRVLQQYTDISTTDVKKKFVRIEHRLCFNF